MRRKVCFLIPGFSDGGAQVQCIRLLNELQTRDIDVSLIHFYDGTHFGTLRTDNVRVIKMPVRSNYDPRNILKLRTVLKELEPDILMSWLQSCDTYGFFLKHSLPGLRWVMTERDSDYPLDPRFLLRRLLGRHADVIVANSQKGADYWRRARARGSLFIAPNIVPLSPEPAHDERGPRILTIGRLVPQKNVATTVEAFALLARRRPELRFAVVGEGELRAGLEQVVARAGVDDRVAFLGFRMDVSDLIRSSALVVSMSHHEGLPNVLLESVAGNTLAVVSDIPEHRELFGPSYPHYVIERTNPERVATAIDEALNIDNNTACLAYAKARIAAMKPMVVADQYMSIFEAAILGT